MTPKLRCKATTADGSPCKAPASLVDTKKRLCPSHDPMNLDKLREAGRRGAEATRRRFQRAGLCSDELPPLDSPQVAEVWLEVIGRAVSSGRLGHHEASAAVRAIREWLRAHEAGTLAGRVQELQQQLAELRKLKAV